MLLPYAPADGGPLPSPPVRYNVRDFGARGDGVANDTAPLQAALAAANANAGGGVVYLPAGTYYLDQTMLVSRSGVVIRGDGVGVHGCGVGCGMVAVRWRPCKQAAHCAAH